MTIQITDMHRKRMVEQVEIGVINLQSSVHNNALTHKKWAQDQMELSDLQEKITNTINAYEGVRAKLRYFRDVVMPSDPGMAVVGDAMKLTLQTVSAVGQAVADHIDVFAAMPRTTYEEIITACDYLIDNVNPSPSVWD
jgi:hypothetical protein